MHLSSIKLSSPLLNFSVCQIHHEMGYSPQPQAISYILVGKGDGNMSYAGQYMEPTESHKFWRLQSLLASKQKKEKYLRQSGDVCLHII